MVEKWMADLNQYHSMIPQTSTHWTMLNAIAAGVPLGFVLSPLLLRM